MGLICKYAAYYFYLSFIDWFVFVDNFRGRFIYFVRCNTQNILHKIFGGVLMLCDLWYYFICELFLFFVIIMTSDIMILNYAMYDI